MIQIYNKDMLRHSSALLLFCCICVLALKAQDFDLNTALMESTFEVGGPARPPQTGISLGTAFFIGKPLSLGLRAWYVLVSAAHVFDDIAGDDLHILFRTKQSDGSYKVQETNVLLRIGEKNLYTKHPSADVAALYVNVPSGVEIPLLGESMLATDETFKALGIHPNEELTALGYPLGVPANEWAFPILRSGKLASYPLTPIKIVKTFLFDFHIFEGNSGGPVYLYAPNTRFAKQGQIPLGGYVQTILGLVSEQKYSPVHESFVTQPGVSKLDLGVIVPSQFIKETIDMMPFEPPSEPINRRIQKLFPPPIFSRHK